MFSPIILQEFDARKYREFLRTLSEYALIKEGKQLRWLSGDGKIVTKTPSAFYEQLLESSLTGGRIDGYRKASTSGSKSCGNERGLAAVGTD